MNILSIGIKDDFTESEKRKIRLTNQITFLTIIIGSSYTLFLRYFYGELFVYPLGCFITSILIFVLNYFGQYFIARFLCSFQMLLFTTLFHAFVIQSGEHVITSLYLSQFSMIIFPVLLYDLDEKGPLILSLAICCGLVFGQQWLNERLIATADSGLYSDGFLNPLTYFFAALISIGSGIILKLSKDT